MSIRDCVDAMAGRVALVVGGWLGSTLVLGGPTLHTMTSLGKRVHFEARNGTVTVDGIDLTDKLERWAVEQTSTKSWLHLEPKADVDVQLEFPASVVRIADPVRLTVQEVEQAVVDAMGYGGGQDAMGRAVVQLLQSKGLEVDTGDGD